MVDAVEKLVEPSFDELRARLNELGERLAKLCGQFSESSSDFLDCIRQVIFCYLLTKQKSAKISESEAADLAQEAIVLLLQDESKVRVIADHSTPLWLVLLIAKRRLIEFLRRRNRQNTRFVSATNLSDDLKALERAISKDDPVGEVKRRESEQEWTQAFCKICDELKPNELELFLLKLSPEELSWSEAFRRLGIDESEGDALREGIRIVCERYFGRQTRHRKRG